LLDLEVNGPRDIFLPFGKENSQKNQIISPFAQIHARNLTAASS
jgi:hypothetical protein